MKRSGGMDVDKVVRLVILSRDTGAARERERCLAIVRAHAQIGGSGGYDAIEATIISGEVAPQLIEFGAGATEPWIVEYERREAEGRK
jgi:hypothetical protein